MQNANFDETLDRIVREDRRYQREAYLFVREALDHTQKQVNKPGREGGRGEARHVTGQELLEGLRQFALDQFGPMALTVLQEWGLRACEDFGELVFNLVENKVLAKTDSDTREDFKGGYDFETAFRLPFLPTDRQAAADPPATSSTKA